MLLVGIKIPTPLDVAYAIAVVTWAHGVGTFGPRICYLSYMQVQCSIPPRKGHFSQQKPKYVFTNLLSSYFICIHYFE